eukprot:1826897-Amphidinium_carterae.1
MLQNLLGGTMVLLSGLLIRCLGLKQMWFSKLTSNGQYETWRHSCSGTGAGAWLAPTHPSHFNGRNHL